MPSQPAARGADSAVDMAEEDQAAAAAAMTPAMGQTAATAF